MSGLQQLYQQLILDHAKEKHGYGELGTAPTGHQPPVQPALRRRDNPAGQRRVGGPRAAVTGASIAAVAWTGDGCSISQASASVLHDLVVGKRVSEALDVLDSFRELVRSRGTIEPDEDVLGDGVAFAGVGRHANRVKCAMLGWTALEDALLKSGDRNVEKTDD